MPSSRHSHSGFCHTCFLAIVSPVPFLASMVGGSFAHNALRSFVIASLGRGGCCARTPQVHLGRGPTIKASAESGESVVESQFPRLLSVIAGDRTPGAVGAAGLAGVVALGGRWRRAADSVRRAMLP